MFKDNENITIVIVTKNNAKTIQKGLESVTKGIRPANQIIVGDNDSTDGTYDLLCKILGAEPVTIDGKTGLPPQFDGELNGTPVKIFRQRSCPTGQILNTAMQMKWQGVTVFGFMDPNSWYAPDKISQAICVFERFPAVACVVSDCDNHYTDGRVERVFRNSFDVQKMLATYEYDRNFLLRSKVFPVLKRGFDDKMSNMEDYELLLRVSEIGLIYHIPAPLHNNRIQDGDIDNSSETTKNTTIARQMAITRRSNAGG